MLIKDHCGEARTLADYQAYVGVDFAARTHTAAALNGDELPLYRAMVRP